MISDIISNKNLQVVIISGRKRNISTVYKVKLIFNTKRC